MAVEYSEVDVKKLTTGNVEIDSQHLQIIEEIQLFNNPSLSKEDLEKLLDSLLRIINLHNAFEESLLKEHNLMPKHKNRHGKFAESIQNFRTILCNEDNKLERQKLANYLSIWIYNHILIEDIPMFEDILVK